MAKKMITRLEQIRKRKGMSRPKLSELAGVPLRMIVQYENAPRCATSAWYFAFLAKALECDIFDILEPIKGSKFEHFKEFGKEKQEKEVSFKGRIEQLKNYISFMESTIEELEKIGEEKPKTID